MTATSRFEREHPAKNLLMISSSTIYGHGYLDHVESEIRDLLGTTRKYAVPLCEYLDRVGVTRREGDLRFLAAGAKLPEMR